MVKDHPEGAAMEQAIISGIAHDKSEAKITIVGVPDRTGVAARIFQAIADADINIDMIVQNVSAAATGLTDISFTLPKTEGAAATAVLKRIQGEIGFASIQYDDQIGKLSLIGAGMRSHPGVTANFFAAMAFAASLGWGVGLSIIPVGIYQGFWTIIGLILGQVLAPYQIDAMTIVGGVMLIGIGLRLLHIKSIAIGNLLPALALAPIIALIVNGFI